MSGHSNEDKPDKRLSPRIDLTDPPVLDSVTLLRADDR